MEYVSHQAPTWLYTHRKQQTRTHKKGLRTHVEELHMTQPT